VLVVAVELVDLVTQAVLVPVVLAV